MITISVDKRTSRGYKGVLHNCSRDSSDFHRVRFLWYCQNTTEFKGSKSNTITVFQCCSTLRTLILIYIVFKQTKLLIFAYTRRLQGKRW